MRHRVGWTPEAIRILADIRAYTARTQGGSFADSMVKRLRRATQILHEHPGVGRPGRQPDTRELAGVHPFVIVYRLTDPTEGRRHHVEILRIWHGAQDRPEGDPSPETPT